MVVIVKAPSAGMLKVLEHVIKAPKVKPAGVALGVHVSTAPAGRPVSEQLGASAALGPALVHTPVTVID